MTEETKVPRTIRCRKCQFSIEGSSLARPRNATIDATLLPNTDGKFSIAFDCPNCHGRIELFVLLAVP